MVDVANNQPASLPSQAAVTIVGGGIAGLASAWQLSELGVRDVVLLEGESGLASHASARNAGIFLPLEESLTAVWLASRSRDLLDSRMGTSWLSTNGVSLVAAHADALEELKFTARRLSVYHERWGHEELAQKLPALSGSACREALHLPLGGILDTGLLLAKLRAWATAGGVHIHTDAHVEAVDLERSRVAGVRLRDGRRVASERVVLAAGAWAGPLGMDAGSPLMLTPRRRHLVQLRGEQLPGPETPVVWRVDEAVYYRPHAGGVLASPCDETEHEPGVPECDESVVASLQSKLQRLAPKLAASSIERSWACLRTASSDGEPAVGPDAKVKGLYWCAGLAGRGMTCGTAAGELLARVMLGLAHPLARPLAPERFV